MRPPFGKALVVATLLALSSSWAAGWAVAWHLASDDHHGRPPSNGAHVGLEVVTHGHAHAEGTPAHRHPAVGSVTGSLPGRLSMLAPATTGDSPEAVVGAGPNRRLSPPAGPNHDPPPRGVVVSVLRI